jgi:hypothetical protein
MRNPLNGSSSSSSSSSSSGISRERLVASVIQAVLEIVEDEDENEVLHLAAVAPKNNTTTTWNPKE